MQNSFHIDDLRIDVPDKASRESEFLRGLSGSYRDIVASVLSIVGDRTDADDVVQEICAILWQRFEEFQPGTNFRKWACAYAFKMAKSYVRKRRRRRGFGLSDDALVKVARLQNAGSELFELRREILDQCLAKMSVRDRRFLMECYGRRFTLARYAEVENIPVSTVYTRLSRLRQQILECVRRGLTRDSEM